MTEKKDESRLRELLSGLSRLDYKELIEILHRDQKRSCHIEVSKGGPYCVTGGIELVADESFEQGASKEHYTLCRCGASNNKPFLKLGFF